MPASSAHASSVGARLEGAHERVLVSPCRLVVPLVGLHREVDHAVDDQHRHVVGVGGGVGLHELGAVALAVQRQLLDAEVLTHEFEVLDRLAGRVVGEIVDVDVTLGDAVVDEALERAGDRLDASSAPTSSGAR